MLRKKSSMGKVLHTVIQGFGKGFDKGTTAGGACLVELYTVYGLVLDLNAFHVLTADVEDTVYLRVEESSGIIVGHCLHLTVVQKKSSLHQRFAVAGGAGAYDLCILRKKRIDFADRTDGSL